MKTEAFAKINLTLDITGRLENGYHSLFTVMHLVSCADVIGTEKRTDGRIVLSANKEYIPLDEKNTCHKAARLFFDMLGSCPGCDIKIENRVPSGAGLGNSSADAAAVLKNLNELFGFPFSDEELLKRSVEIGADVPFCFAGGTRLCLGTGEIMRALPAFDLPVIIVKPEISFPTAGAYARYDEKEANGKIIHPDNAAFLSFAEKGDWLSALKFASNVFEQIQPETQISAIKTALIQNGAVYSAMSGSGSAVFGVFDRAASAEYLSSVAASLSTPGTFTSVCLP